MSKTYVFEGKTYIVPDDATLDEVQAMIDKPNAPPGFKPQVGVPVEQPGAYAGNPVLQGLIGVGKGAASTGFGIGHLLGLSRAPEQVPELQPSSGWEKVGKGAEQIGEYVAPVGAEEKLFTKGLQLFPELAKTAPTLYRAVARGLIGGASAGTIGTLQSGSPQQGMKTGLAAGFTSALGEPISQWLGSVGRKIEMSTIRPRLVDYRDLGTQDPKAFAKVISDLKLTGNLQDSYGQVFQKLNELRTARDQLLDPNLKVDLATVFKEAESELKNEIKGLKVAGQGRKVLAEFNNMRRDVYAALSKKQVPAGVQFGLMGGTPITKGVPDTTVGITRAEDAKEAFGLLGAWSYGRQELDAVAKEKAANTIYLKLKQAIEGAIPDVGKLREYNREMSKLIPVKNAMLARIPVEERNRLFSLADVTSMIPAAVTGNTMDLALLAAIRAQKSLRFGNLLNRQAPNVPVAGSALGKIFAGMVPMGPPED